MLVIENLLVEYGPMYPKVFFDGDKEDLLYAIECDSMVVFTHALDGRTKEVAIRADSIISYESEVDVEEDSEIDFSGLEGVKVIMFPTAGFKSVDPSQIDEELLQRILKECGSPAKKTPPKQ